MSNINDDDEKNSTTYIIYDENLKEVWRIARNSVDPKDFKVDPYIKKIDGDDFYCISNKMNYTE
jgi:GGDEF domain-containing protein